jgi:hypothetical protein
MDLRWIKLQLPANPSTPSLFIQYVSTRISYRLLLTDLTKVWSEDISRQLICERAVEIGTSIDPSEDQEQFTVFLQKIHHALEGKEGTQTKLIPGDEHRQLQLKTLTPLTAPFQPLEWCFRLDLQKDSSLTEDLLVPLLKDHVNLNSDLKALTSSLEEKDRAIAKLLDKIEGSGLSLSDVFPSLRGSRKSLTRSVVESSVPGLATFDPRKFAWKSETAQRVFEHGLESKAFIGDVDLSDPIFTHLKMVEEKWWLKLDNVEESELNVSNGKKGTQTALYASQSQSQGSDSAFQVGYQENIINCSS